MRISVWDTYVTREDGKIMHFDILVPETVKQESIIFGYGKTFLDKKPFGTGALTSKECRFCHIESATDKIIESIEIQGFHIIEMENCN